jgi:zinc protease
MIAILLALACAKHPEPAMSPHAQPPQVGPAPAFTPIVPSESTLSNGATLWHVYRPGLPLISLELVLPGGSALDPSDAPGTAYLADAMVLEGAGDRDATAFSVEADRLAIDIDVATSGMASFVSLEAHTDRFDDGMNLFADVVLRPRFEQVDLDRIKDASLAAHKERMDDPRTISAMVMDSVYYGQGHPLAPSIAGTEASITEASIPGLKTSWSDRYAPTGATFVVVGDVSLTDATAAIETRFADWTGPGVTANVEAPKRPSTGPQLVFVDHPGTSQTSLRVTMPAPATDSAPSVGAQLGSIVLGGTFTSRLNQLLREDKGYTYGARARVASWKNHGTLTASTAVQLDVSGPALKDLIGELQRYQEGIDEAELLKARSAKQTRAIEAMGTRSDIASIYAALAASGRPAAALPDGLDKIQASTIADVQAGISASQLSQSVVLVVGDLDKIRPSIEAAVPGEWTVLPRPD